MEQESLANAKESARSSACMKALVNKSTTNQRKENWKVGLHSVGYNAVAGSIFIRLAVVASKICEIARDSLKNSNW